MYWQITGSLLTISNSYDASIWYTENKFRSRKIIAHVNWFEIRMWLWNSFLIAMNVQPSKMRCQSYKTYGEISMTDSMDKLTVWIKGGCWCLMKNERTSLWSLKWTTIYGEWWLGVYGRRNSTCGPTFPHFCALMISWNLTDCIRHKIW